MCQSIGFVFVLFCSLNILFMDSSIFNSLCLTVVHQRNHKRMLRDCVVVNMFMSDLQME